MLPIFDRDIELRLTIVCRVQSEADPNARGRE